MTTSVTKYETIQILGFDIFCDTLESIRFDQKIVIDTINAYSYILSKSNPEFKKSLVESNILLPDGFGFVLASKIIYNHSLVKISGYTLFTFLMNKLNSFDGTAFFLGSTNETLEKIRNKIKTEFPKVNVGYYSPPFSQKFSEAENNAISAKINEFSPHILFVGMTAPKQETWVFNNAQSINCPITCSIGAVFDFYAGTVKPPNKFLISIGLEWLSRLINDPKKMWKRYLKFPISRFLFDIFRYKLSFRGRRK